MPPLPPHTVENLGPSEISILIVELKIAELKIVELKNSAVHKVPS
jgi:hypothetical protein